MLVRRVRFEGERRTRRQGRWSVEESLGVEGDRGATRERRGWLRSEEKRKRNK